MLKQINITLVAIHTCAHRRSKKRKRGELAMKTLEERLQALENKSYINTVIEQQHTLTATNEETLQLSETSSRGNGFELSNGIVKATKNMIIKINAQVCFVQHAKNSNMFMRIYKNNTLVTAYKVHAYDDTESIYMNIAQKIISVSKDDTIKLTVQATKDDVISNNIASTFLTVEEY